MSQTIRTFFAVKIQPEDKLRNAVGHLQKSLSDEAVKWVEPDNLHLTLKFLGDIPVEDAEQLKEKFCETVSKFQPFKIGLHGLGFFKSKGQPRVLFVNIENLEPLKEIFTEIEVLAAAHGFEPEMRKFKPHLTLARIKYLKNKKLFYGEVENYLDTYFQEVEVSEMIFYQSILKPAGPEYRPLKSVKLKS